MEPGWSLQPGYRPFSASISRQGSGHKKAGALPVENDGEERLRGL